MSFLTKLLIINGLAIAVALIVVARKPATGASSNGAKLRAIAPLATSVAVAAGALLVVGIVSHTLIRHLIQIVPLILSLILLIRRSAMGVAAAAPLLAFWFLIMGGIWLFLLGFARIFTGTFSPIEIALTVVIGSASLFGIAMAYRQRIKASFISRLSTVIGFAVLQLVAMWISIQPFVARR
jgi:hypothetical protein